MNKINTSIHSELTITLVDYANDKIKEEIEKAVNDKLAIRVMEIFKDPFAKNKEITFAYYDTWHANESEPFITYIARIKITI